MGAAKDNWLSALRVYLGAGAALHLVWEIVQLPLYTLWRSASAGEIAFAVAHCTAGDVMIATLTLAAALVLAGDREWPAVRFVPVAAIAMVLGVAYTGYSEWVNTIVRRNWAYSDLMPTLPLIGTGLSPLAQWVVVPTVAFWLVRRNRRPDYQRAIGS